MGRILFLIVLFLLSGVTRAQTNYQNLAIVKPIIPNTYNFSYTGSIQKFIVPNGVSKIEVNAIGAKGGNGTNGQSGGAGANITTTLDVNPGQTLYIVVGGSPGQSATAKYGFGGNGGYAALGSGGAGGGLTGVFTSNVPSTNNALVVAGGGGGGSGSSGSTGYNGGAALNSSSGAASNGQGSEEYPVNGRFQYGFGASVSAVGVGGYAYDNAPDQNGVDGNGINGGKGGEGTIWEGAGGGGAGFYGGGGGAGGGSANGGGGGGATKSTSSIVSFGTANNSGDGSLTLTCNYFTSDNLVLHYNPAMTESYPGTGDSLIDLSGTGMNGTISNLNYDNLAFTFNGESSQVSIPDNSFLEPGSGNWTIEVWFKNSGSSGTVIGKYRNGGRSADISYALRLRPGNSIRADFSNGGTGINNYQVTNSYSFTANNWVQMVYVWDKSNSKIYTYSNGILKQTTDISFSGEILNTATNLYLGSYNDGEYDQWFTGKIGVVRLYQKALDANEVLNNFNANKDMYNL